MAAKMAKKLTNVSMDSLTPKTSKTDPHGIILDIGCGGHLGRHIELHFSVPHFIVLWVPYKDQESKLGDT